MREEADRPLLRVCFFVTLLVVDEPLGDLY